MWGLWAREGRASPAGPGAFPARTLPWLLLGPGHRWGCPRRVGPTSPVPPGPLCSPASAEMCLAVLTPASPPPGRALMQPSDYFVVTSVLPGARRECV